MVDSLAEVPLSRLGRREEHLGHPRRQLAREARVERAGHVEAVGLNGVACLAECLEVAEIGGAAEGDGLSVVDLEVRGERLLAPAALPLLQAGDGRAVAVRSSGGEEREECPVADAGHRLAVVRELEAGAFLEGAAEGPEVLVPLGHLADDDSSPVHAYADAVELVRADVLRVEGYAAFEQELGGCLDVDGPPVALPRLDLGDCVEPRRQFGGERLVGAVAAPRPRIKVCDFVNVEVPLVVEEHRAGHVVGANGDAPFRHLVDGLDRELLRGLRHLGLVEECVVAPDVVDDGGRVILVDGLVPALGLECEDLAVVVDDVDGPAETARQPEEHVGGDADLAPPGLGVRRLLGHGALFQDVVVYVDGPVDDLGPDDAEGLGEELEEGFEVEPVLAQDPREWWEVGALRQVGFVDDRPALEELPRLLRRDVSPPQLDVGLELALCLREVGRRRALVAAGVELELEVVEDRFDVLDGGEEWSGVAPIAADLRPHRDGSEQLMRDAAAVEVLRGLGDEVELPEHLAGKARHALERSIQERLDRRRSVGVGVLDLGGELEVAPVHDRPRVDAVEHVALLEVRERDAAVFVERLPRQVREQLLFDFGLLALVVPDVVSGQDIIRDGETAEDVLRDGQIRRLAGPIGVVGLPIPVGSLEGAPDRNLYRVARDAVAREPAERREAVVALAVVGRGVPSPRHPALPCDVAAVLGAVGELRRLVRVDHVRVLVAPPLAALRDEALVELAGGGHFAAGVAELDVGAGDDHAVAVEARLLELVDGAHQAAPL